MRDFFQCGSTKQFSQTVARIAFAISRNGGVYCHHQRGKPSHTRPFNGRFGSTSPTNQIKLVPNAAGRSSSNLFQLVPGDGGKREWYSSRASRGRSREFSAGVHQPAVTDGRQNRRKSNPFAKDFRLQI